MFTQTDRWLRRSDDSGFTLVEVIVALSVFAVVAFAALPLLLVGLKASGKTRVETLAKDLSQLRLERMRNLPFHVDRQNGPFIDLLDSYFTNASGAVTPTGEANCTGRYLSNAPGTGGAPSGAAYRVTCDTLPEATHFSQVVYTQFLARTAVPVPVAAGYDTQVSGLDATPTQLLGVTVVTSWNKGGNVGTLRTYTEIADSRDNAPLITTQAQALALKVSSNDADNNVNLVASAGQVKADGSLTSGSVANVQTIGASLEQLSATPGTASSSVASAVAPKSTQPANPAGDASDVTGGEVALGASTDPTWLGCGWGWATKSAYSNVSATTAGGVPWAPSNVGADALATNAPRTSSGLLRSGNGCQGYGFGFRNWLTSPSYNPALGLSTAKPLVYLPDSNGGGPVTSGLVLGRAAVSATDALTSVHDARATARARVSTLHILPTNLYPDGLVQVSLNSSSISCRSGTPVTASYNLTVAYPGGSQTLSYTSGGAVPVLPAPSSIAVGTGTLADYLQWNVSAGVNQDPSGASSIDHVFALTVPASVAGNGGFGVQLGALSCVAADNR